MKTVEVRIPCVVNSKGQWNAVAWSEAKDAEECLNSTLDVAESSDGEQIYWFVADLPIPEVKTLATNPATGLKRIKDKCTQYWNTNYINGPEIHAILEFIHREAELLEAAE